MTLDEYQALARRTLGGGRTPEQQLANAALGLAGEAGGGGGTMKKHLFPGFPLDREALGKELGDCLGDIAMFATELGVTLDEIGETNIEKLKRRYPDGFSPERSQNRSE